MLILHRHFRHQRTGDTPGRQGCTIPACACCYGPQGPRHKSPGTGQKRAKKKDNGTRLKPCDPHSRAGRCRAQGWLHTALALWAQNHTDASESACLVVPEAGICPPRFLYSFLKSHSFLKFFFTCFYHNWYQKRPYLEGIKAKSDSTDRRRGEHAAGTFPAPEERKRHTKMPRRSRNWVVDPEE